MCVGKVRNVAKRVQVIVDEREKERFERQADADGVSLSAWLRDAGRERLAARQARRRMTLGDLRKLFAAATAREVGREPDWTEHLAAMEGSRARGRSTT